MTFLNKVLTSLTAVRQTGQTTMCVGVLFQNPDARMVVGTYQMKKIILRDHPVLAEHQIITVENLPDELSGSFNNLLVFDNTAVIQLLNKVQEDTITRTNRES